jgi:hypothetical protein
MKTTPLLVLSFALVTSAFAQSATPSAAAPAKPAPPAALPPPEPIPLSQETLGKIAAMKPIFDGKTLDGWIQMPPAALTFDGAEFKDYPALVKKLTDKSDAVSAYLAEQFDDEGKASLAAYSPTADAAEVKKTTAAIRRNINRLVGGSSLYDEARFQKVLLRPDTVTLLKKNPRGMQLARLNRVLLEDAYPQELARGPAAAWVVKEGAMASTGAGRGVIFTQEDYGHYRLIFQVRQNPASTGNHVPGILVFCQRPPAGEKGLDALGAVQFQVPNGGHWDYRPGINKAGAHFTRPIRIRFNMNEWAQVELLVNAKTGKARMAVAQPVGARGTVNLLFDDPAAARVGPIAWQMHNANLLDEFKDVRIEIDPKEDRLLLAE